MIKNRRSQVHVSETILVLFVVIVILMMGVVVYFKFSVEKNKDLAEELSEEQATIMLAKAVGLQELSCDGTGCIDTAKFLPFKRVLGEDFDMYRRIFGRKKITITEIYPVPHDSAIDVECDVIKYIQMEYPENCGKWTIYDYNPENELGAKISTIVSLYYPEFDEYRVGRLEIEHYGDIRR
ncbi:hypothetical protein HOG54_01565 [Candidatus Woesearchaeota archaeon]|jgi:hypothetical protein|nr:hypothetical protein [Candidatus Woesearchaeota archaeon]